MLVNSNSIMIVESLSFICNFNLSITYHKGLENLEMLLGESCSLERRIPLLCHLRLISVMQLQVVAF